MDGGLRQGDTPSVNSWPPDHHSMKNSKKLLVSCSSKTMKAEAARTKSYGSLFPRRTEKAEREVSMSQETLQESRKNLTSQRRETYNTIKSEYASKD